MKRARHKAGQPIHRCDHTCQTRQMTDAYRRARADEEQLHENGGPKPTLTFKTWLKFYWECPSS